MGERAWRAFLEELEREGGEVPFATQWSRFREAYRDRPASEGPPPAWWPDEAIRERSNLASFMKELGFTSYGELYAFSIRHRAEFWSRVVDRLGIVFAKPAEQVLDPMSDVRHPRWFEGALLDVTRSCFTSPPERTAIVFGGERTAELERVSYGELESRVNRFAGGLHELGLERGDAVALYMPMTPECVVAYLGTVRSGGRVVSVADSFSAEELRARLEIAGARAVVTVQSYERGGRTIELYPKVRQAIEGSGMEARAIVIGADRLDGDDVAWERVAAGAPASSVGQSPDHVVNVLFSSGTTGEPKAIPWTELTPLKCAMDAHFHQDVHPGDVVCWPTNIGWMMGPWLIYASLVNEAAMALYEGAPTGQGFLRFVREASVSVLGVVPSIVRHWRTVEAVPWGGLDSVRLFSSTGEASGAEDYLWLMSRAGYRAPVIEYLGGTEIGGGHLTATVLQPASPSTFTTPALGTRIVLLDDSGQPVSEGATGELFLVPPSLGSSQTLLNRDHDEVYYAGCPAGPSGEVLRRHGDEIARLARGTFKAQGRADDTMNLGGIKVSSIELERAANTHPAVYESAAVGVRSEGEGTEKLVLFVVSRAPVDAEELRKELAKAIAERLNPLFRVEEVVLVESLPRTASNKVMRRELRRDFESRSP